MKLADNNDAKQGCATGYLIQFCVRFDSITVEKLKAMADSQGLSVAALVRELIEEAI